jgi:carbamoyl-phosphate synthase large subunit
MEGNQIEAEFAGRRMLFLPGGQWQVPVIRLARQMGFHVTCLDGTPNPPGFAAAHEGIRVSLQDLTAVEEIARARGVDVVMTEQTDFAVPIVARLARALGLPGLPVEVADAATNKGLMRERARSAGVRQPEFRICRNAEAVRAAIDDIGLPLFYKPVDSQSSRGVGVLNFATPAAIAEALARALLASRSGAAIFEQFIQGTECTVEGFVTAGRPYTLAISDKEHYSDLPGVARTLTYPAHFPQAVLEGIAAANEATVRAIGITCGITHAEFIVDEVGRPWLVEIAARGGGSLIASHIVPALTGFHPTVALIRALMGQRLEPSIGRRGAAQLRFLRLPQGRRIAGYSNLEELRRRPGILELMFHLPPGTVIPAVGDDRSRHGFVITHSDTRAGAVELANTIERDLRVKFADYG